MKHLSRSVAVLSLLALLGAGCGSTPAAPTDSSPTAQPAATAPAKVADAMGDCFDIYFPLKEGSTIEYHTKSGTLDTPMTVKVVEHNAASLKLEYTFHIKDRDSSITNELVCENGGIHGKGYFSFANALSGLDISYDTVSMTGDILPKDLTTGKEWTSDNEVVIHTGDARFKAMMDGKHQKTHAESKVIGEEQVTVPAGTFTAVKVEQTIDIDTGIASAPHIKTTSDTWYAKDVGMVRVETKTGPTTSVTEATKVTR